MAEVGEKRNLERICVVVTEPLDHQICSSKVEVQGRCAVFKIGLRWQTCYSLEHEGEFLEGGKVPSGKGRSRDPITFETLEVTTCAG